MHYEILAEDASGEKALNILVPKIIDATAHTIKIHSYKGIGSIPKNLKPKTDAKKRILLDQLPRLLQGYGNRYSNIKAYAYVIAVVCDLDSRDKQSFSDELNTILDNCNPKPNAAFCLAVEEMEAWFLGDMQAILNAYPNADKTVLQNYRHDSICGTWEKLADAIYKGGSKALKITNPGAKKCEWAENIAPYMNVDNNLSPSFQHFRDTLRNAVSATTQNIS